MLRQQVEELIVKVDFLEVRADHLRSKMLLHEAALREYTYHTITAVAKACKEEIDKFDETNPKDFKTRIWHLREALDQHNKRSGYTAMEMADILSGKEEKD